MDDLGALEDEEGAWHTCQLVCGKTLPCGNHTCPALDHKGTFVSLYHYWMVRADSPLAVLLLRPVSALSRGLVRRTRLSLPADCHPPSHLVRPNVQLLLPVRPASSGLRTSQAASQLPRERGLPALRVPDDQGVRVRQTSSQGAFTFSF